MTKGKRVLFLTNLPSPYRVKFFSRLGTECDLTVVYERHTAADRNHKWTMKSTGTFNEIFLKGIQTGDDTSLALGIFQVLKRKFDVIVIGMYSTPTAMLAIAYLRAHHRPFIISTDGGFVAHESRLKYHLKRLLISSASSWLSPGKFADEYLVHYGARAEHIHRYPFSSVERHDILTEPKSISEKKSLRLKKNILGNFVVVSVGQPIERKGFDVLVEAFMKANIVGSSLYLIGATESEFEKVVGFKLPDNVYTVEFQERKDLFEFYQAADTFVLATHEDIWGLVLNEAMANGLPVITTDRCGAGLQLIDNGNEGFIIRDGNVDDLCEALLQSSSDALRSRLSQNSLDKTTNQTIEEMVSSHLKVFDNVSSR
ncbi:glycosyltransferase family 4 protein [Lacticaseibacillus manihotivorans]|nr:glycosyltransferase family 4 protein [Lacticaseibacillus manihotivorans]